MENTKDNYKIYVHINKTNGKMYVGQTKQEPNLRWRDGLGYRDSPYFWKAINKYGWDGFEHIILFEGLSQDESNIIEIELIKKYNTNNELYGYNLASGGNSPVMNEMARKHCSENHANIKGSNNPMYGKHHSEETKEKIRKTKEKYVGENATRYGAILSDETKRKISMANKGKKLSEEAILKIVQNNPNRKPVFQIHYITKEILNRYESSSDAGRQTGVSSSSILACCSDVFKYNTAGGYIWMFCEDYDEKINSKQFWDKYKVIGQFDENYNLVNKWAFPRDIKNNLGIKNVAWIATLCRENKFQNLFCGYHWKYM